MTRKMTQTIVAMAMVACAGVAARATAPSPPPIFTNAPLARGTNDSDGTIPLSRNRHRHGADAEFFRAAIPAGIHIRGRNHRRRAGVAHRFRIDWQQVRGHHVRRGQAFIERPGRWIGSQHR